MKTEFTIVTWNIAGGRPMNSGALFDYDTEDLPYFATELHNISPDIICFQETHVNDERSVGQEIADLLGQYHVNEMRTSSSHVDPSYQLGNAVLSKPTPTRYTAAIYPYPAFPLFLPDGIPDRHHDKGFQVVQFPFGTIMNTHTMPLRFLGTPYDTPNGLSFAHEMEKQLLTHALHPLIFCGDFNFNNASILYPELLKDMKSVLPDAPTRPGGKKSDYIFVSAEFTILDSGIIQTNTDHYLCWAKLSIN